MTNYNGDPLDDGNDPDPGDQTQRTNAEWAAMRKETQARKKAEADAAGAKRELAFLKSGIDMADPKMQYFVKGYEGDLTAEAITKAATDAGFITPAAPPPPADPAPAVAAAQIAAAAAGATGPATTDPSAQLAEAHRTGGDAAMYAKAKELGIPMANPDR
jgi:hypothetical protein